eukprot:TRINITY_DN5498_c0_g1_i10.p7 TRINITY_DN5498_c0_g1~~TRINITY_DN5498_c0_g1_i10.p7  ORF type:complete len:126 (-),score=3.15 TRINITY_DN5498_c0_g1_i10:1052-1429(-)
MGEQEKVGQFCRRVKQLADDLKIAGQDISELTPVSYILGGLTHYYIQVICALQILPPPLAQLEVTEMERGEENFQSANFGKIVVQCSPFFCTKTTTIRQQSLPYLRKSWSHCPKMYTQSQQSQQL